MSDKQVFLVKEQVEVTCVGQDESATRGHVGQALRVVRESQGLGLRDIAEKINLSRHTLTQLEEGRFDALNGAIFVKGYIRAYCEVLAVSPEEYLKALPESVTKPRPAKPVLLFKAPASPYEQRSRRRWWMLLSAGVLIAFFVGWLAKLPTQAVESTEAARVSQMMQTMTLPTPPAATEASNHSVDTLES